ncbi:MAG: arabinose-5-phosphate isomerase [Candidatus Binatota bacterium]|nr:arabinose-5-phosphate isomerase [Candidatus Binatota bacterium]
MGDSKAIERGRRVLAIEAAAVEALIDRLDSSFERAVDALLEMPGKAVVTGLGKSGIIGRKIAATLASTGTPAFFVHAAEGLHGDLGMIVKGDAVIALSNSGETRELVSMLPLFKRLALPLIVLTGTRGSTVGRAADVVLDTSVREEACPLALAPTASTTAALAMGDALALAVMERRGFRERDFAFLHPAGSLGHKLLRVADLMHRGEKVPLVGDRATLAEAIGVISDKRLGHAGVVDGAGRLVGILTDGDLRRLLQRRATDPGQPIHDLMSREPKTIGEEALGAEALAVMERHSITALFVVDDGGRPTGVVHLHDLLRAGVV